VSAQRTAVAVWVCIVVPLLIILWLVNRPLAHGAHRVHVEVGMRFAPTAQLDVARFRVLPPAHTRQGALVGEAIGC